VDVTEDVAVDDRLLVAVVVDDAVADAVSVDVDVAVRVADCVAVVDGVPVVLEVVDAVCEPDAVTDAVVVGEDVPVRVADCVAVVDGVPVPEAVVVGVAVMDGTNGGLVKNGWLAGSRDCRPYFHSSEPSSTRRSSSVSLRSYTVRSASRNSERSPPYAPQLNARSIGPLYTPSFDSTCPFLDSVMPVDRELWTTYSTQPRFHVLDGLSQPSKWKRSPPPPHHPASQLLPPDCRTRDGLPVTLAMYAIVYSWREYRFSGACVLSHMDRAVSNTTGRCPLSSPDALMYGHAFQGTVAVSCA
jgi:hypothetical protein